MRPAREIMAAPPVTVREGATLEEVARTMLSRRIGCVLVVDDAEQLRGIITESDFAARSRCVPFSTFQAPQLFGEWLSPQLLEEMYAKARSVQARQIMTSPVQTVEESASVHDVVSRMLEFDVNRIPVVRNGVPVGVVSRRDLLKMMVGQGQRSTTERAEPA